MEGGKSMTPEQKTFMDGLLKLTRETGLIIGGCGCCNSPWLAPPYEGQDIKGKYKVEFVESDSLGMIEWENSQEFITGRKEARA